MSIHGIPWLVRRRWREQPPLTERQVERLQWPRSGQVQVAPLDEFLPPVYPPDEPTDSVEIQHAQAFVWGLHRLEEAFRGGNVIDITTGERRRV